MKIINNSYLIIAFVLLLSGMLIMADNIQIAYASNITLFPTGVNDDVNSVLRYDSDTLLSIQNTANTIRVYDFDGTNAVFTNSIATAGAGERFFVHDTTNRIYYTDRGAQIAELDSSLSFFSKSQTAAIACGDITLRSSENAFFCVDSAGDAIDRWTINASAFTQTAGASLNGGGFPCDSPVQLAQASTIDVLFVACSAGVTGIIAINDVSTSTGANAGDAKVAFAVDGGALAVDHTRSNLLYCQQTGTSCTILHYTSATSTFTSIANFTLSNGVRQSCAVYDPNHDRYMVCTITGDDRVRVLSPTTGSSLGTVEFSSLAGAQGGINIFSSSEFWIGSGTADDSMIKFDNIGLSDGDGTCTGSCAGGSDEPDQTGGIDCTIPANANILICRLALEPCGTAISCNLGNATGQRLLELGCNVIFVTCEDTNPQTNGMGLLAFIASLFVIIGMFYYTIGKEAFHMPIFIWIVIVIALSAFFTIAGWIDPVFLVLTIVALVALAVPKIMNIVRGSGSTLGEGSSA